MKAPFFINDLFGLDTGLVLAVLIGIGFGFVLERAGFGSSRRLAAQFYLYDMTVFKVMFTAIITAMIGLFGLAKIGFLDIEAIWVNPTFLWPQIVGGLLLGIGFIVSGYCPGTSIVASASGKIDGMLTLLGVAAGIFIFGLVYTPGLATFHTAGDYGRLLLSDVFNIDPTLLTLILVVAAGSAFILAEWVERKFAKLGDPATVIPSNIRIRYATSMVLVVIAIVFALQFSSATPAVQAHSPERSFSPLELAQKIVEGSEPLTVIDLRSADLFQAGSVSGSINLPAEELKDPDQWLSRFPSHHNYVLVGDASTDFRAIRVPASFKVFILNGGFDSWKSDILSEPIQPERSNSVSMADFRLRQAMFSYFTGAAVKAPQVTAPPPVLSGGKKKKKPTGGC